jgi:hypothetical protein
MGRLNADRFFGVRSDYGQSAPYCLLLRLEPPCRRGLLDLAIETASISVLIHCARQRKRLY